MSTFITHNQKETQKLAEDFAKNLKGPARNATPARSDAAHSGEHSVAGGGVILCLEGELGAGKTTFTQGLLKALGAEGPFTSPTFVIMKQYELLNPKSKIKNPNKIENPKTLQTKNHKLKTIYHFDVYRVSPQDVLNLGWSEIISDEKNVVIVEWADRIRDIIPREAIWIKFEWMEREKRKITINKN